MPCPGTPAILGVAAEAPLEADMGRHQPVQAAGEHYLVTVPADQRIAECAHRVPGMRGQRDGIRDAAGRIRR